MAIKTIFPVFYFGSIAYYAALLKAENVVFEKHENFPKQTFRNRCEIMGPNGLQKLVIPLAKATTKRRKMDTTLITYDESWVGDHWKSIEAAYRSSPYFEFYEYDIKPVFEKNYTHLFDLTLATTEIMLKLLKVDIPYSISQEYSTEYLKDYRTEFSAKTPKSTFAYPKYIQVFNDRMEFIPNLSILDLLFNEGPQAKNYLEQL